MELNPATRGSRFGAYFLDSLILGFLIILPQMLPKNDPTLGVIWLLAFVGLTVYQAVLLTKTGQTIGKRAANIKIVKVSTNEPGGIVTNVLLRSLLYGPVTFLVAVLIWGMNVLLPHTSLAFFYYNHEGVFQALGLLSFVYILLGFIDILFVFRKDRRCLHDFIARTRVVRSQNLRPIQQKDTDLPPAVEKVGVRF